jgi:hypothetical protein
VSPVSSRRLVALLLYVLLLAMQHEGYRHGLEHLRAQLIQAHEHALQLPDAPCVECALLAGGTHAAAAAPPPLHVDHAIADAAPAAVTTVALETPRYYAARAPPVRS